MKNLDFFKYIKIYAKNWILLFIQKNFLFKINKIVILKKNINKINE